MLQGLANEIYLEAIMGSTKEPQEKPGASSQDSCCNSSRSTEGLVTSFRTCDMSIVYQPWK